MGDAVTIRHIQQIYCRCQICKKDFKFEEVEILDGQPFVRFDPTHHGWQALTINGKLFHICPKHRVTIIVDGEVVIEVATERKSQERS